MSDYFVNIGPIDNVRKLLLERPEEWEEVSDDEIYSGVMHTSGMLLQWSHYLDEMWLWKTLGVCEEVDKVHHVCLMDAIFEMMVSKINKANDPPVKIIKLAEEVRSGQMDRAIFLADEIIRYFNPLSA